MSETPNPPKTKAELFAEDPDRFVDINSLVIATQITDKGLCIMINSSLPKSRIYQALGTIQVEVMKKMIYSDAAQNKVIPAKGGILNAARKGLFRK